ncbi:hypothetical protein ACFYOI_03605 [Streptomyces microflavus]|uniref:hypothetical protein n=1 Tax=Streptomyces microflavus TaxID=1919 RepID=UPI0033A265BD
MPTRPLPHDPYANAVMAALSAEGLLDAANSWTAYDCDNGEVMMMETVINLDPDRARAAGYDHGVTLLWNHTRGGWEYGPTQHGGHLQYVADLITGAPVAEPTDLVRAAQILLDPNDNLAALPITGTTRPPAQTIPPLLQAVLDEGGVEEEMARDLSAYA